jgi:hypothetical protein
VLRDFELIMEDPRMHSQNQRSVHEILAVRRFDVRTLTFLAFLSAVLLFPWQPAPTAYAQTRAECRKCCEKREADDYYREQCKLKCFRNPTYCTAGKRSSAGAVEAPSTQPVKQAQPTPKRKRRRKQTVTLAFPKQLEITPGKEWEAAAQILAVNGIQRNNPRFQQAMNEVTAVLIEFARGNPQGGNLNTKKLERILVKYK